MEDLTLEEKIQIRKVVREELTHWMNEKDNDLYSLENRIEELEGRI